MWKWGKEMNAREVAGSKNMRDEAKYGKRDEVKEMSWGNEGKCY